MIAWPPGPQDPAATAMIDGVMDRASNEPRAAGHRMDSADGSSHLAATSTWEVSDERRGAFVQRDTLLRWRATVLRWLEVVVGGIGVAVGWSQRRFEIVRQNLARHPWARAVYRWLRRPAHARSDRPPLTRSRVAERLAEALAPVIVISATALFVALPTATSLVTGIGWAALAVLFNVVIPEARNWLGTWRDEHEGETGVRVHRRRPITFGLAPMVVGLGLLLVLGAPRELVALSVALLGVLHAVAAIRRRWRWRPSVHTAVAAGCVTALIAVFGPALMLAYLAPVAVGWARVVQGERSGAETVGGAFLGIAVTTPAYLLIA